MTAYVARQPIYDRALDTSGYSLKYRPGGQRESAPDPERPCDFSPDTDRALVNGRTLMLHGDPRALVESLALLDQVDDTTVVISAGLPVTDDVRDAARKIERLGASLAIEDVTVDQLEHELLGMAKLICVDVSEGPAAIDAVSSELATAPVDLLAANVEREDQLEALKDQGFEYFTGDFLARPSTVCTDELPALASSRLLLLREINRPDIEIDGVTSAVSTDVGLTHKLLTLVSSASIGLRKPVTSVKHATSLLGVNGIRKLAASLMVCDLTDERPREIMITSLIRAAFCESIAQRGPLFDRSGELYLLGLFSMIDALLNRPIEMILTQLPLASDLKDALQGEMNDVSRVLDLVTAYENANWAVVDVLAGEFAQHEDRIAQAYRHAVSHASELASL